MRISRIMGNVSLGRILVGLAALIGLSGAAVAATPGITASAATAGVVSTSTFNLNAGEAFSSQPDGTQIYSWGYGCSGALAGTTPGSLTAATFAPAAFAAVGFCPAAQMPGPTLIVTEGQLVTVTLTNHLPLGAGNTSILFPGFQACAGKLTYPAANPVVNPNGTCSPTTVAAATNAVTVAAGTTTLTVPAAGYANGGVVYTTPPTNNGAIAAGTPLALVTTAPTAGQYNYSAGLYTFNVADAGATLTASGTVTTVVQTGVAGIHTQEAAAGGGSVTYTFVANQPGTHSYYSGTQPDLQIEMGLYGALIVLPKTVQANCTGIGAEPFQGPEFRLSTAAYDHAATCFDREYLFQFAEMDARIHATVEQQKIQIAKTLCTAATCPPIQVGIEPYRANYFLINGRSMPDDMDANYAPNYPAQPYNGNPHMHPLELTLLRVIGQGRLEHPFHEHANHVRILARDGNLMLSQTDATKLAGLMMFTTDTLPGQAFDGIFYWSGKGLNWDLYGHKAGNGDPANAPCNPDANGFYTAATGAVAPAFDTAGAITNAATLSANYGEWCADHNNPLEANPVGNVASGGAITLPDPLVATNGLWYNGTPYLGPDATTRSRGPTPLPPGGAVQNPPGESGIAFMWHSHNEREITTNDVFPGGMLMMMLVDPPVWYIDETL